MTEASFVDRILLCIWHILEGATDITVVSEASETNISFADWKQQKGTRTFGEKVCNWLRSSDVAIKSECVYTLKAVADALMDPKNMIKVENDTLTLSNIFVGWSRSAVSTTVEIRLRGSYFDIRYLNKRLCIQVFAGVMASYFSEHSAVFCHLYDLPFSAVGLGDMKSI